MGSGASTGSGSPSKLQLSRELSSREDIDGSKERKLGPEYTVLLQSPPLAGVAVQCNYILRVGYEALILCSPDEAKVPLAYFKYQDIICWGSTNRLFQFKVFGTVFDKKKDDHVVILFKTNDGKALEKITLESVYMLMADMDKTAVLKSDFIKLKELLSGTAAPAAPAKKPPSPPAAGGEREDGETGETTADDGGAKEGDGGAEKSAEPEDEPTGGQAEAAPATSDAFDPNLQRDGGDPAFGGSGFGAALGSMPSFGEPGGGGGESGGSKASTFFATLKQFAASRCFTVHQGVDLMKLARRHGILDSFEEMELAVWLWDNTLNRDSFQLIVNVFQEEDDRHNLIYRIQAASRKDKASAALLRPNAPTAGGGLVGVDGMSP